VNGYERRAKSELGRQEEGLKAYEEALDRIWPFFESLPEALGQKTALMIKDLLQSYEALHLPVPPVLQRRIEDFMRLKSFEQQSDGD
jgi:hypothetical protein